MEVIVLGAFTSSLSIGMEFAFLIPTLAKYSFMTFAMFFDSRTVFPSSVTSLERETTFLVFILAKLRIVF